MTWPDARMPATWRRSGACQVRVGPEEDQPIVGLAVDQQCPVVPAALEVVDVSAHAIWLAWSVLCRRLTRKWARSECVLADTSGKLRRWRRCIPAVDPDLHAARVPRVTVRLGAPATR